ncbi:PLP-dependent aminotransferase family protein [Microbacterium sediminicola]|uniref:PLP-dependent aminotransferase family protein n=1 Tax=Microbacterium sediminicola TaxID=415210 RepID=A0ABN2HQV3_9MICO
MSARALTAALGGWRTREPAYEALADGIRILCLDNRIAPRTVLPAERELATALGLSRSTVSTAYQSLRDSGHISSLRGSGSVTLPLRRSAESTAAPEVGMIDLQQASPPAWPGLAGYLALAAADAVTLTARAGYDVLGRADLREQIAQQYRSRGIPTSPGQIMVTTGAQSAIHLLATALITRGDRVVIETPTYPHAADAFRLAGARLIGVPVATHTGWDLERLTELFFRTRPALAYLMPDFQNPTGRSMTADDRAAVLEWAERTGTMLLIDETTADLDIDRGPRDRGFVPTSESSVIRIGSLGKTVWGGLRVGWIRADAELIDRLVVARPSRELGTPEFEQSVALRLIPVLGDIVRDRAAYLRAGRDAVVAALGDRLPAWQVTQVDGGVALWVELDAPLSSALVMGARAEGVLLSAGPRFALEGGNDRHLRIPFTAPPEELIAGVEVLARVWPSVVRQAPVGIRDMWSAPV